jgi:hypothetical protein
MSRIIKFFNSLFYNCLQKRKILIEFFQNLGRNVFMRSIMEQFNERPMVSLSGCLTLIVTDFVNGPDASEREMSYIELIGRKIVGELCYAGIIVASLVETVARGLLALLAIPLSCCVDQKTKEDFLYYTLAGTVFCGENAVFALTALVQNLYQAKLEYVVRSDEDQPLVDCVNNLNENAIFPFLVAIIR